MESEESTPEIQRIVDGYEAFNEWLCTFTRPPERRATLTFHELREITHAKAKELGISHEDIAHVRDHSLIRHWEMEIGMSYEAMRLDAPDYFWGLPLDYKERPEYQALIQAEEDWIESNGGTLEDKDVPVMMDAIKHHMPGKSEHPQ